MGTILLEATRFYDLGVVCRPPLSMLAEARACVRWRALACVGGALASLPSCNALPEPLPRHQGTNAHLFLIVARGFRVGADIGDAGLASCCRAVEINWPGARGSASSWAARQRDGAWADSAGRRR